MKFSKFGFAVFAPIAIAACSGGIEGSDADVAEANAPIIGPSTPGGRNEVVLLHMIVNGGGTRACTGTYFAPRVVLTAAHCLTNIAGRQLFIYHGDNFPADVGQLQPGADGALAPPPPGSPSFFAQADSWEIHPSYDPNLHYVDMGVVYLDRKLPFDPLPLWRNQVAANRTVTITGWGSNSAPTPTTGAGSRVQRTGTTVTLGSPTAADFHPEDPNPGVLDPAIRPNLLKTNGAPPNANGCFGDSGGPMLFTESGQLYVGAVGYFTGLSCLDYNLWTRLNPFLPFLDNAYKKGGQETLIPSFECVTPNPNGTLTALFGFNNKNGVSITLPYGTRNQLARDTFNARPTRFVPGQHRLAFPVDFTSGQTVSWRLQPDNSPTTTLNVTASSRRCNAAEADQTECALACRTSTRVGCANDPGFETCIQFCQENNAVFRDYLPACVTANRTLNQCQAALAPTPASNWECFDFFGAVPLVGCAAQIEALQTCIDSNP